MAIHRQLSLATLAFSLVLASGPLWPAAADPGSQDPLLPDPYYTRDLAALPATHLLAPSGIATDPSGNTADRSTVATPPSGEQGVSEAGSGPPATDPARLPSPTPSANARVSYFLDRFTGSRRDVVSLWVGRSTRYIAMMRETLRGHGLPEELVWVAMIESGFNPVAKSRAGARGLWQFMPGTARRFGLRVDQWVDERVDPERSTLAASAYLRDLYALFGSWPLAWAAYNAGEVAVSRAIQKAGSHDFWALAGTNHLRRETKDFVPQIEAATLLAREPERYGFELDTGETAPAVESVSVPPSTDLRRLSDATGLSLATLRDLNPALIRAATPPGAPWDLRVPEGSRGAVEASLVAKTAGRTTARTSGEVHVVQPRDTIGAIAKRYGVSVDDVLRWNGFDARRVIRPGDRVRVAEAEPQGQGGFR